MVFIIIILNLNSCRRVNHPVCRKFTCSLLLTRSIYIHIYVTVVYDVLNI